MSLQKCALAVAALLSATAAAEQPAATTTLPAVTVTDDAVAGSSEATGSYTVRSTTSATKLPLAPRETPQVVTVITRTQIEDFRLNSINDALEVTPGVTVERVETDRTYYTARGFAITNFQYDGIGTPIPYGLIDGDIDTAVYDRIEVVRGATGLISPMGDPSATINFVRKRPTRELQASADLTVGSWENYRLEADVAGPFNDNLRGRLVLAHQDKDSYLDRYAHRKTVIYGVLEGDLSERTTLSFGHTFQDNQADSPMWGSLPLIYSDGSPTDYDVSTSTSPHWSFWDGRHNITFLELAHELANGWQAKGVLSRRTFNEDSKLFYLYGQPDPNDPDTGLFIFPSLYSSDNRELAADVYARGPLTLAGRQHDLVLGASWARVDHEGVSHYGDDFGAFPYDLSTWDGNYPEPNFDNVSDGGAEYTEKYLSAYAAARLILRDDLLAILGARAIKVDIEGDSYGESKDVSYGTRLVPYAGLIFDLSKRHSLYGSVTAIYRPQAQLDVNRDRLPPAEGVSYETGVKSELFGGRLNTTFALFYTEQDNLADAGTWTPDGTVYAAEDYISRGIELEAAGELLPGLQLSGGYTYVNIDGDDGSRARTYVPEHMLRALVSYRLQSLPKLKVGAGLNWQSETYAIHSGTGARIEQDAYALLKLMARYEFTDNLSAVLNLYNVTDEKYVTSLQWANGGQGFYGAPRNVALTLSWNY